MISGYELLIAIGIALAVWVGGEIGHGLKKVGHALKHAGQKVAHVVHHDTK